MRNSEKSKLKKKILFLIHTLQVGGAEKVLVNLVNKLDKEKYDITVMTVINTGAFRSELAEHITYKTIFDIKFFNRNSSKGKKEKSGNLFDNAGKIKKFAARFYQFFWRHTNCEKIYKKYITDDYDVEVAFLEGVAAKIIANSNNKKSKKISWIHVDLINENKTEKFFRTREEEIKNYQKFDKIVAVSKYVKEQAIKKLKLKEENVIVCYNPIDTKKIEELSNEKVEDIRKEGFTICSVGRLSNQKGYDRLLEVAKKLNEDKFKFELWIIGVGEKEEELNKYIELCKLDNVRLLGYRKNPYKYMKMADLFVCSSRAEGFSTVVSEAVILEKPVVTTLCSGMKEILGDNGEYGIICNNDTESLYEEMKKILKDHTKIDDLKRKIVDRKEIFDLDKSIKKIEEILDL